MGRIFFSAGLAVAALSCGARGDLDDGSAFDPSVMSNGRVPESADASALRPIDAGAESEAEAAASLYQGKLPADWLPPEEDGASPPDAGDGSPPQLPYSLVLYGVGFESYELHMIGVAVVRMPEHIIVDTAWRMVAGGTFFLPFPSVLQEGVVYRVDYFVDIEEDGLCQPGHDPAWRVELPAAAGDVDLQVDASTETFAGACAAF